MRGEVEIYRVINDDPPELIFKESNLLVDGASKTIADMLTTSPSLSGVESASALLDVSNYTIQAISFGKPWELFSSGGKYISGHFGGSGGAITNYHHYINSMGDEFNGGMRSVIINHDRNSNISSITWQHLKDTPESLFPTDTRLQQNSTKTFLEVFVPNFINSTYTSLSGLMDNSGTFSSVDPRIYPVLEEGFDNGQNLNLLALSGGAATYFQTIIDGAEGTSSVAEATGGTLAVLSALNYPQTLMGCYPPSDGINVYLANNFRSIGTGNYYLGVAPELSLSSNFNWLGKESMDASGWVRLINPAGIGTVGDPNDGLVVSANPNGSFSSTGEIVYKVTVSGGDAACASLFGGIWYMGLWTFDNSQMLCNGTTPPYTWNNISNPRRYRLFSKKAFTKDITYHIDNGTTAGLVDLANNGKLNIIWRLYV